MISREKRLSQSNPTIEFDINKDLDYLTTIIDDDGNNQIIKNIVKPSDLNKNLNVNDFSLDNQIKHGLKLNEVSASTQKFHQSDNIENNIIEQITLKQNGK